MATEEQIAAVVKALDSVRSWSTPADYRRKLAIASIEALSHAAGQEGDTFAKAYGELARAVGRAGFHINCDRGTMTLTPAQPPASAEVGRLREAAARVNKLYPMHWDRVDGAAVVMPDRIEEFEKAFAELDAAMAASSGRNAVPR